MYKTINTLHICPGTEFITILNAGNYSTINYTVSMSRFLILITQLICNKNYNNTFFFSSDGNFAGFKLIQKYYISKIILPYV